MWEIEIKIEIVITMVNVIKMYYYYFIAILIYNHSILHFNFICIQLNYILHTIMNKLNILILTIIIIFYFKWNTSDKIWLF